MAKQLHRSRGPDWAGYKTTIVDAANRVAAQLNGCGIDEIRQLVDANEIVFGVWQDRLEPDGVGMMPIKGQQLLRVVVASGKSLRVNLTAIPCTCIEEAMALQQVVGEPDRRH